MRAAGARVDNLSQWLNDESIGDIFETAVGYMWITLDRRAILSLVERVFQEQYICGSRPGVVDRKGDHLETRESTSKMA